MRCFKIKAHALFIWWLMATGMLAAQNHKELADQKIAEAINLMDQGYVDESIRLINEALKLHESSDYYYELGYAYYLKQDYVKAIEIVKPLLRKKDAKDIYFQFVGNCYDYTGNKQKAIDTYLSGLKKFPFSGRLYLELGTMYAMDQDYNKAVEYYEKGIDAEPGFPSNYYRLAQLFLSSDDKYWGLIYGELFMNLERNTPRTADVSRWLYNTYAKNITFPSDTTVSVILASRTIYFSGKKLQIPYGLSVYVPLLSVAARGENAITLAALNRIRSRFTESYFLHNRHIEYPNVLFNYHKNLMELGHFEAYNYWILSEGNDHEFNEWLNENNEKWDAFISWFRGNPIHIDHTNKFLRSQY